MTMRGPSVLLSAGLLVACDAPSAVPPTIATPVDVGGATSSPSEPAPTAAAPGPAAKQLPYASLFDQGRRFTFPVDRKTEDSSAPKLRACQG
jgi:hypothetical protein